MAHEYSGFAALAAAEREGHDWRRVWHVRGSPVAIIAPHGGGIEAGTSELAHAIAGEDLSVYIFDGLKLRGNDALHVRSTAFDDRVCLDVLASADTAIALHGCAGADARVFVGGRDALLRERLRDALHDAGFAAVDDDTAHSGRDASNVCNRGRRGAGAQLEMTHALRTLCFAGLRAHQRRQRTPMFTRFAAAVRGVALAWPFDPTKDV